MDSKTFLSLLGSLSLLTATPSFGCDLCGCYTVQLDPTPAKPFTLYAAVAEQFTHFGTDRLNGDEVANPSGQYLDSSITQLVIGASFLENRLGLQLNIPLIYRAFKRPVGFDIQYGHVSGLGDISLLANYVVFRKDALFRDREGGMSKDGKTMLAGGRGEPDFSASLNLTAGPKFRTGDSSRIEEEFSENEVEGAPESGIHGHDLALGTGSFDGVFGAQLWVRYKALFFQADTQFTWRGQGLHSYRFANDFSWNGGPGVYLHRKGDNSLGVQCVISGETKGYDTFLGEPALDTGVTSIFLGPRIVATLGRWSADVSVNLPVLMNTTSFQSTPDYRLHAGLSIQF